MKSLIKRIEKILNDKPDLGQIGLAKAAGASKSVVNQWLDGKIKSMRLDYALNIERSLGYNHVWLVLGQGEVFQLSRTWPFSVNRARFDCLPQEEKERIDGLIEHTISVWENRIQTKNRGTG